MKIRAIIFHTRVSRNFQSVEVGMETLIEEGEDPMAVYREVRDKVWALAQAEREKL